MTDSMNSPIVLSAAQTLQIPLSGVKLIEASAGTGKTYAISNLYLRFVLAGRKVSEILVVTFTNAATEELRGRIRTRLHEAVQLLESISSDANDKLPLVKDDFLSLLLTDLTSHVDELPNLIARLRLAVRTMDEASIYTIHGFCQRALTDQAFSSGQAFDLELISDDDPLWQDALKDWWRRSTYELGSDELALLKSSLGSLAKMLQLQRPLRHGYDRTLLPVVEETPASLYEKWRGMRVRLTTLGQSWMPRREELTTALLESTALSRTKTNGYKPEDLLAAFDVLDNYFAADDLLAVPDELQLLCADHLRANNKATKLDSDPRLQDEFFIECQTVIAGIADIRQRFRIAALIDATDFAAQQTERIKTTSQTISFNDQLTRLLYALEGETGQTLADALRKSFPVAMIDEFQDTDLVQYGIFRLLYLRPDMNSISTHEVAEETLDRKPEGLIMIGDPKQAIYSFRGGDIFAYAEARNDAGENLYTLDTNWRSVPALITAVNTIFKQRETPFVYAEAIEFTPVLAANKNHAPLYENDEPVTPMTLWKIPLSDDGKPYAKTVMDEMVAGAVSDEIARLIVAGQQGNVTMGERALRPGDIAVLVRTNNEGARVRDALAVRGVSAVSVGRETVFECAEAKALELLLSAVEHYGDRNALRVALSTDLLGLSYSQIAEIVEDLPRWLQWAEQVRALNVMWRQKGFMSMFSALLQTLGIGLRIALQPLAERRLTNLLHLAELLQQTSKTHSGMESLLAWYREQIASSSDQETELRLESDEALVKIVTIHASKGLEYPVVFVPWLWTCKPRDKNRNGNGYIEFHNGQGRACLDMGTEQRDEHLRLAEKERLAEDVRLAYVALTRARAKVYLAWGDVGGGYGTSDRTALAWLLHSQQNPEELVHAFLSADLTEPAMAIRLQKLANDSNDTIVVEPLPTVGNHIFVSRSEQKDVSLAASIFTGSIATDWRVTSFSGLTRAIHQPVTHGSMTPTNDPIFNFAAGSQTGLFLHKVLENLDFQGDIENQAALLNNKFAEDFGFDAARQQDIVVKWMHCVVSTPLDEKEFALVSVSRNKRLDELEFDFSVNHVSVAHLNQVLANWHDGEFSPVGVEDFRGMITGIIDLVFEHEGRFFVADYKSNFLGTALTDYAPNELRKAILERRYDLQYLIYTLALHRYLRQRITDYSYGAYMGGVYYLFLRGMRPESGPRYGVYHDLPSLELIEMLDKHVFGSARVRS